MTEDHPKKLLDFDMLTAIFSIGLSIVSMICTMLLKSGEQADAMYIFRIIGQLSGFGGFGFGAYGLVAARKAEKKLLVALLCLLGLFLGALGSIGTGM